MAYSNLDARETALALARSATERILAVVLVNADQQDLANVWTDRLNVRVEPAETLLQLCRLIGESPDRIAAFVVRPAAGKDYRHKRLVKKLRELASAEGALLIWDEAAASAAARLGAFYAVKPDLSLFDSDGDVRWDGRPDLLAAIAAGGLTQ